jgi:hypothetical protein
MKIGRRTLRGLILAVTMGLGMLGFTGVASASTLYWCSFNNGGTQGYCTITLTYVNQRSAPTSNSGLFGTLSPRQTIILFCWTYGQSINGDNIWYLEQPVGGQFLGAYVTGYYLDTGRDPAPPIPKC